MVEQISQIGGAFALLAFNHVIADWVFQTDQTAHQKSHQGWALTAHSGLYTLLMLPLISLMIANPETLAAWLAVVFASHWVTDTYLPTWGWLVYIRRYPKAREGSLVDFAALVEADPLVLVLCIVVDQILHLLPLGGLAAWVVLT